MGNGSYAIGVLQHFHWTEKQNYLHEFDDSVIPIDFRKEIDVIPIPVKKTSNSEREFGILLNPPIRGQFPDLW